MRAILSETVKADTPDAHISDDPVTYTASRGAFAMAPEPVRILAGAVDLRDSGDR